ncbi:MAG: LysM peptidoglycan-binding domain-containing protein [Muribaculaceae bacterium]|nr:LysM peptidoglycan-binding domain-containing protein [Muribaculaceae bacterium]
MKKSFRNILFGAALGAVSLGAFAIELPVKRVNGTDYYYYTVQRNESLMDVAQKLGITRDDILRTNPAASDGIRMGMTIYLPVREFSSVFSDGEEAHTESTGPLHYKVQRNETLFGIAYRFGVTPDQIAALNPSANAGVKAGDILLIPASEEDANVASHAAAPVEQPAIQVEEPAQEVEEPVAPVTPPDTERRLRPVNPPIVTIDNTGDTTEMAEVAPVVYPDEERRLRPVNPPIVEITPEYIDSVETVVAVLLPLMLDEEQPGRQARSATDFTRGFLLGAKSLNNGDSPVKIQFHDTKGSVGEIASIMAKDDVKDADVIIAPEDHASFEAALIGAAGLDAYVMNLCAVQDTSYIDNPQILQTYIPAQLMYAKAAEALISDYEGYTPVFLASKGGRGEKVPFTNYLRERYASEGIEPMELVYDGMLNVADVADLDRASRYVFIPASGSLGEFNKFARTLLTLRDEFAVADDVALFGYPDWTTFRGDAAENLHRLNATIYSRFYCDERDEATHRFLEEFEREYGAAPMEQVPSQALLGYDIARYLLTDINANEAEFLPTGQPIFRGLQSSFLFDNSMGNDSDGSITRPDGLVNQCLYIVRFLPGDSVSVKVL